MIDSCSLVDPFFSLARATPCVVVHVVRLASFALSRPVYADHAIYRCPIFAACGEGQREQFKVNPICIMVFMFLLLHDLLDSVSCSERGDIRVIYRQRIHHGRVKHEAL